ncbi:MAG: protoporphyrinogen oxidase [Candidatus Pacearchaeota archaeon]|nr:MAG: protoporphyrinogen oxidase [Candidatus Pacearchaeota archaeon]
MEIYQPSEDSFLMYRTIKEELKNIRTKDIKFLEIGVGSGINLFAALNSGIKKENIIGTDINEKAVNLCKGMGFNCIKSDLFKKVKGKFDLIVFNPPYLPLDKREPLESRISTSAGLKGNEIIIKFLNQAKKHLKKNGKIFLIVSSLSKKIDFEKLGYLKRILNSEKFFFEEIFVLELKLKNNNTISS